MSFRKFVDDFQRLEHMSNTAEYHVSDAANWLSGILSVTHPDESSLSEALQAMQPHEQLISTFALIAHREEQHLDTMNTLTEIMLDIYNIAESMAVIASCVRNG